MKKGIKTLLIYSVLIFVIIFSCVLLLGQGESEKPVYSDIIGYFEDYKVKEVVLTDKDVLVITLKEQYVIDGVDTIKYQLRSKTETIEKFFNDIDPYDADVKIEIEPIAQIPWYASLLPYVIIIVLFIVAWVYFINKTTGKDGKITSFGRAKVKLGANEKNRVYFTDVAGADEEKEELREIVEFLRDPAKFHKLGAKIPHGVLLVGPPGTGKTLLAKAVAGEADVPFFSISGSDFVEMYVGVGASRVRDLFETAKKAPASIIFIDEIDAVGRRRGTGLGGGHDEKEQTLNQLLVEMDGFGGHDGVIVIAATNRPDILDPALLRPGRFDRQVTVGYPDIKGREEILHVHAKGKPFESDVDFKKIAQTTVGFAGADLANLLNEAALLAARKGKSLIGMIDIEESLIKIAVGTQKKNYKIKPEEKRKTAYHEAGHAMLAYFMPTQDPVRQISIIPSGNALGYTLNPPVEDKFSDYKNAMKEEIAMCLAGRAAEALVFDDISGGASGDIKRATAVAKKMVTVYGMSEVLGTVHLGNPHGDDEVFLGRDFNSSQAYSEQTAALIDSEIKKIIDEAYAVAMQVLSEHREKLDFISEFLVEYEVMDDEQFKAAMEREMPTIEEIAEIGAAKRRRSEEENKLREAAEAEARRRDEEEARKRAEAEQQTNERPHEMRGYGYDDPFDPNHNNK